MLNWIVLNWTVYDSDNVLTLNWIVITARIVWNRNIFDNCEIMVNWIVLNRSDIHKNGSGVK